MQIKELNKFPLGHFFKNKLRVLLIIFGGLFCIRPLAQIPKDAMQVLVVTTDGWNSFKGRLSAFEKTNSGWSIKFSTPIVVGKNGLGLDSLFYLAAKNKVSYKKEGDGKSPAGMFQLGPAFGYAQQREANWIHLQYVQSTSNLLCVDDDKSAHYDQIISTDSVTKDWTSAENMRRMDNYYKWGIVVQYNYPATIRGRGSCIFIHIWDNDSSGTVGCTAMSEPAIMKLLNWIDQKKHPLLIQLPMAEYKKIYRKLNLPRLR
ncbi:MAG: L,D-transpeptidase family protein [Bacteroidetes bacterium]|nr:L,D-transpeptidase family protein [Bacteroidota bacterium]